MNIRRGALERSYWANCGGCEYSEPVTPRPGLKPAEEMRERGWKYTRDLGWICSDCVADRSKQ